MDVFRKIIDIIRKIETVILVFILAVIVVTTFLQVIGRFTPLPLKSVFEEVRTISTMTMSNRAISTVTLSLMSPGR